MHRHYATFVCCDAYYTELVLEIEAGDRNSRNRSTDSPIELPQAMPMVAWVLSLGIGLIALARFL